MKKFFVVIISVLFVAAIGIYAVNWAFFDIQRIEGQELIDVVNSPDGKYTISVYLNNGGATTDYAVLCSVKNNETEKERNIYWNYHYDEAEVQCNSEDTATINGVKLNVTKDTYDYRND